MKMHGLPLNDRSTEEITSAHLPHRQNCLCAIDYAVHPLSHKCGKNFPRWTDLIFKALARPSTWGLPA